jgi:hypothetical protein
MFKPGTPQPQAFLGIPSRNFDKQRTMSNIDRRLGQYFSLTSDISFATKETANLCEGEPFKTAFNFVDSNP